MENKEQVIRDYLNGQYTEEEIANIFNLKKCPLCGEYNLEEDMLYHKWDLGQVEEQICESCRGDE